MRSLEKKFKQKLKEYQKNKADIVEAILIDFFKGKGIDYHNLEKGSCKIKKKRNRETYLYQGEKILTIYPPELINDDMGNRMDIKVTVHYLKENK